MKNKVQIEEQPLAFIRRQPPESRRSLRDALHAIESGRDFPEPLTDELDGFYKVKVGSYRMVLQTVSSQRGPLFRVVFAEKRRVVYELFAHILGLD